MNERRLGNYWKKINTQNNKRRNHSKIRCHDVEKLLGKYYILAAKEHKHIGSTYSVSGLDTAADNYGPYSLYSYCHLVLGLLIYNTLFRKHNPGARRCMCVRARAHTHNCTYYIRNSCAFILKAEHSNRKCFYCYQQQRQTRRNT